MFYKKDKDTRRSRFFKMYIGRPVKENLRSGKYGHIVGLSHITADDGIPWINIMTADKKIEAVDIDYLQLI